jgi:hypothetical protein
MEYAKDWRFPTECPICNDVSGTPQRVTSNDNLLTVALRCAQCHHQWVISAPSPSLFAASDESRPVLRRKPDRRGQPVKASR